MIDNDLTRSGAQSPSLANLLMALATMQGQIDNVAQDRDVEVPIKDKQTGAFKGKYKFRYATLAGILNHLREPMAHHGLWYTQRVDRGVMVTRIYHSSGEWMDAGHLPMPDIKGNPQDIGSIISYFKRYSLSAALGLAAEEDNDGEIGDREVNFRARGAPRAHHDDGSDDEPPMGWGDWVRGLIQTIQGKESAEELDQLRDQNKRLINSARKHDASMYEDIGRAFTARRAVVDKGQSF